MVYWITGLSGAGKTTIGTRLYRQLKETVPNVVFLDGDELRYVFGGLFGYSESERRQCAMCYARMCKLLSDQGMDTVICTISMFHAVREWNRSNIANYMEIYIRVSMETLRKRDQKGLYSGHSLEADTTVAGIDIDFEEPQNPDVIIDNDGDLSIEECVKAIEHQVSLRKTEISHKSFKEAYHA